MTRKSATACFSAAFVQLRKDRPDAFRVVPSQAGGEQDSSPASPLPGADRIMNHTIFLGTYPGLTEGQIDYMVKVIRDFAEKNDVALKC